MNSNITDTVHVILKYDMLHQYEKQHEIIDNTAYISKILAESRIDELIEIDSQNNSEEQLIQYSILELKIV